MTGEVDLADTEQKARQPPRPCHADVTDSASPEQSASGRPSWKDCVCSGRHVAVAA